MVNRTLEHTTVVEEQINNGLKGGLAEPLATDVYPPRALSWRYALQLAYVGLPLCFSDAIASLSALGIALASMVLWGAEVNHAFPAAVLGSVVYCLCFWAAGLYPGIGWHPAREIRQLTRAAMGATAAMGISLLLVQRPNSPYVIALLGSIPLHLLAVPMARMATKSLMHRWNVGVPCCFLGSRREVALVYRDMQRFGWTMLIPRGRYGVRERELEQDVVPAEDDFLWRLDREVPYAGDIQRMLSDANKNQVHWLFLVGDNAAEVLRSHPHFLQHFPELICSRASRSLLCSGTSVVSYGLSSGIRVEETLLLPWSQFTKRAVDCVVAALALLILSPLFALVTLAIRSTSTGRVFFSHQRIGKGGRSFNAWKFRSMVPNADEVLDAYLAEHPEFKEEWGHDHKLKNDPRVTWIGRLIRKSSLDELPQLWNVFVGEMSLVGPRPIVAAEVSKYGFTYHDYLRVTPGITGLWQISGRNNTTYAERLAYDEFYVRNWSPWLDMYILLRTVKTVLLCEGAY